MRRRGRGGWSHEEEGEEDLGGYINGQTYRQTAHWDDAPDVWVEHLWRVMCEHYGQEVESVNLHIGRRCLVTGGSDQ